MKLLSIDTETTGLDPNISELLEIGIVVFDSEEKFTQTCDNSLRIVLCKPQIEGNIFAINLNIDLLNEINVYNKQFDSKNGLILEKTEELTTLYVSVDNKLNTSAYTFTGLGTPTYMDNVDKAANYIKSFITSAGVEGKYNIAGKNFVGFDKEFISKYLAFKQVIVDNARHRVLDVGSMYVDPTDKCLPNLSQCLERAGLPHEVPHTAVEDAILVVKAAQAKWIQQPFNNDGSNFIGIPSLQQLG